MEAERICFFSGAQAVFLSQAGLAGELKAGCFCPGDALSHLNPKARL